MVKKYKVDVWDTKGYTTIEIEAKDEDDLFNKFLKMNLEDLEFTTEDSFIADIGFRIWQNRWFKLKENLNARMDCIKEDPHHDLIDHESLAFMETVIALMDKMESGEDGISGRKD